MATTAVPETKSAGPAAAARVDWHRLAPPSVRRAYRKGKDSKGWAAWVKHLAGRRRPVPLEKLLPDRRPLRWALPPAAESQGTPEILSRLERLDTKRSAVELQELAAEWMAEPPGDLPEPGWAVEALSWSHALPKLSASLGPDLWWKLLDCLLDAVADGGRLDLDRHPLAHQLIAGELAVTLGCLFPEINACRKAGRSGRRALSLGLVELTDGEGFIHGAHIDLVRPLLACWTRCRALGDALVRGCWNKKAEIQYKWLVRHALRLARHDGSHVLARDSAGTRCDGLLSASLELAGDRNDWNIAAVALPGGKKTSQAARARLPKPAYHSPWGMTGVLRAGWSRDDARLVVVYADDRVRLELESAAGVLLSGVWDLDVRLDGRRLEPASEWSEVCWLSDRDIDYLELELELSDGITVQRHIALAREDRFAFLADAVVGGPPQAIEYRGLLPLGGAVEFRAANKTREGLLAAKKPAALVLPLALPEWRIDPRGGTLDTSDGSLELRQSAHAAALWAPLFIDLAPRRFRRPLTWRQLTVAENLRVQPPDVAVGYRLQVGKQQWLIYRSLAAKDNRTLLGHNLVSELLIARFRKDGEVETLVEIE